MPVKTSGTIKIFIAAGLSVIATNKPILGAQSGQLSLLETNQSFRSKYVEQPNLEKGEVAFPVQASIIYVLKQELADFLRQVAGRNDINVVVTERVTGNLEKISLPMELDLILPELAKTHGLQWHFHNRNLYVSSNLENSNRLIRLGSLDMAGFHAALKKAGIRIGSNRIKHHQDQNSVLIIGSRQFISTVEKIVKSAEAI